LWKPEFLKRLTVGRSLAFQYRAYYWICWRQARSASWASGAEVRECGWMSVGPVDGAETVKGFGNSMFRSDNAA